MRRINWLPILILGCLGTSALLAQPATQSLQARDTVQRQLQRLETDETRDPLYSQWRKSESLGQQTFDWGGWSSYGLLTFDNDDNDKTTADAVNEIFIRDQRVWGKVEFEDGSSFYGRVRYINYNFDMGPGVARPFLSNERLDLDLAYYDFKIDGDKEIRLGRQFLKQGSGLTMLGNYDGVEVKWGGSGWSYSGLLAKSLPNDVDVDPLMTNPRRYYGGLNVSYLAEDGKKYFGYYLGERDDSKQPIAIPATSQRFDYDADYFAIGSSGDFDLDVSYYMELIAQKGSQIALGPAGARADIDARAGIGKVIWHPEWDGSPSFTGEYAFASGDSGRLPGTNVTSSNAGGSDNSFLGFGRYDGGLALNPRLSNIHVLRFGAAWKPWLESDGTFQHLMVGSKYSRYRKDDPAGGISDLQATAINDDVGTGLDVFLGWKPLSDISVIAQWGRFSPGDAYPVATRDDAESFFVNMTWSF